MKTRIFYIVVLLALLVVYRYNYEYTVFVLITVLIILLIPLFFINLIISKFIKINIDFKTKVIVKDANAMLNIAIENRSILPVNRAIIHIEMQNAFMNPSQIQRIIIPIKANDITNLQMMVKSEHCGYVKVSIKKIILYDLFGVTSIKKRGEKHDILSVIPQTTNIKQNLFLPSTISCDSDEFSHNTSGDDKSQVFDYHEYSNGDHVKNINWKLSSRLDKMMVKEFSLPLKSSALILFELSIPHKKTKKQDLDNAMVFDALFEILASLSNKLNETTSSHTIKWYNKNSQIDFSFDLNNDTSYDEEFYSVLGEIYKSKFYDENLLLQQNSNIKEKEYSRIFYITTVINKDSVKILSGINSKNLLTVVYVSNEKIPNETDLLLKSELIDLIEINTSQISVQIEENFK